VLSFDQRFLQKLFIVPSFHSVLEETAGSPGLDTLVSCGGMEIHSPLACSISITGAAASRLCPQTQEPKLLVGTANAIRSRRVAAQPSRDTLPG
jgi:hypothetical protein